ncbi:huntingtin-like, partial [Protobothrops mucrosquamatus]|uniref:huntingtin-like n=1 Tax=Protobothrops mucrosquamatus TaxID=103944 RepID=UPI000775F3C5
ALMDSSLPRLQLELYKEIKKNGASRSLRAALWRFAELAHLVRPQKCRPYFVNLLPCLTRVSRRPEESVQETLAAAMPKIMAAFGNFANDSDIKVLLKAFIGNLNSNSPTIRRTAAAATVSICQHSRRTQYFYTRLLQVLLGLLCPKEEEHPSVLILGVLLTLRYLIPLLQQQVKDTSLKGSFGVIQKETEISPSLDQLIQREFSCTFDPSCQHFLDEVDSALEAPSPYFPAKVLSGEEEGLEEDSEARSETSQMGFAGSVKSELSSELAPTSGLATAAGLASDPPACDIITEQPRSQHVLQSESELPACDPTGAAPRADADDEILSRSSSQISAIQSDVNDGTSSPISDSSQTTTEGPDSAVTPSDFSEMILEGGENQYSGMQIGQLQDEEEEATSDLHNEDLDPFRNSCLALVPDKEVRVSVKALAISCVGAAVALHPEAFFSKLFKMPAESVKEEREQYVKDIVNYIDHGDPQIRGTTA